MNTDQSSPLVKTRTTSNTQSALSKISCCKHHTCQFLKPVLIIPSQNLFVSYKIKWANLQSSRTLWWKTHSYHLEFMTSFLSSQSTLQLNKFRSINWQGTLMNWKIMEFVQPFGSKDRNITMKWWMFIWSKAPMPEANSTWEYTIKYPITSANKAKTLSSWLLWHLLIGKLSEAHTIGTPKPELYLTMFSTILNTQLSNALIKSLWWKWKSKKLTQNPLNFYCQ